MIGKQARQKSKSPKSKSLDKELQKSRTQQSLRRRQIYGVGQPPALGNPMHSTSNVLKGKDTLKVGSAPKYQLNIRRHHPPAALTSTELQLRQIEKELKIERPRIMRKSGQSYEALQNKLIGIQSMLSDLKENMHKMVRPPRRGNSKNRNKSKKSSSIDEQRLKEVEEEKKQDDTPPNTVSVHRYVQQIKKADVSQGKERKSKTTGQVQVVGDSSGREHPSGPYYTGKLVRSLSCGLPCDIEQHLLQALQAINFMKTIKPPTEADLAKLRISLPKQDQYKKTVLLDLDETLIHCNEDIAGHVRLPIKLPDGQITVAGVNIRPHARRFLEKISASFQVIVFTASHPCYANIVLDHLDPDKKFISQRLFRQHCYLTGQGMYIKDLRVIQNRDLKDILLVDNAPYSYYFQMENGVPIVPYYQSQQDQQLLLLQKFLLEQVHPSQDVRTVLRQHFKLHQYPQFSNINQLIESLYQS